MISKRLVSPSVIQTVRRFSRPRVGEMKPSSALCRFMNQEAADKQSTGKEFENGKLNCFDLLLSVSFGDGMNFISSRLCCTIFPLLIDLVMQFQGC